MRDPPLFYLFIVIFINAIQKADANRINYVLTDPGLHVLFQDEEDKRFGDTNGGIRAMNAFFATHTCNEICKALSLKPHPCQPHAAWDSRLHSYSTKM